MSGSGSLRSIALAFILECDLLFFMEGWRGPLHFEIIMGKQKLGSNYLGIMYLFSVSLVSI